MSTAGPHRASVSILLLLGLATSACARETPATATRPPVDGAPPPPPAELSRFSVPLEFEFSSMIAIVERAVPRTFGSLDSVRMIGTDTRRHYAFEAHRGPFTAFAEGRLLQADHRPHAVGRMR
jgi:hypothetical protein